MSPSDVSTRGPAGAGALPCAPEGVWGWLVLAGLIGCLRLLFLGEWSLWIDEAFTLSDAYHSIGNYNRPAYVLVRWAVEALGPPADAFSLRLLPAAAGWLAIPASWWALHPWIGRRRAAYVAVLVALSPWELYWSQNARFYTLLQLCSLVGAGFVLRGLDRRSAGTAVMGFVIAALGSFLHLGGALVAGALALGPTLALLLLPGARGGKTDADPISARVARILLLAAVVTGAIASPWLFATFERFREVKDVPALASVVHLVRSGVYSLTPVLSVAAFLGALTVLRSADARGAVMLATVACGGLALMVASLFARGTAQYGFAFMPFITALAVWPIGASPFRAHPLLRVFLLALLAAPLVSGTLLYFTVHYGQRPRWREAYEFAAAQRGPDDLLMGMQAPVGEFYLSPTTTDLRHPEVVMWCDRTRPRAWRAAAKTGKTVWIVVRPALFEEWPEETREPFVEWLRTACRLQRRFDVHQEGRDLDVEVYRRR